MNNVILSGRLTADPDVRYSQGENSKACARYTLAVSRPWKSGDKESQSDFISCVCFGKTAEFVERYLHKGSKIIAIGRIQTGSYTNRDGQKVYTTNVIVNEHEFAESKDRNASYEQNKPSPSNSIGDGFMNIPDGVEDTELPFN